MWCGTDYSITQTREIQKEVLPSPHYRGGKGATCWKSGLFSNNHDLLLFLQLNSRDKSSLSTFDSWHYKRSGMFFSPRMSPWALQCDPWPHIVVVSHLARGTCAEPHSGFEGAGATRQLRCCFGRWNESHHPSEPSLHHRAENSEVMPCISLIHWAVQFSSHILAISCPERSHIPAPRPLGYTWGLNL